MWCWYCWGPKPIQHGLALIPSGKVPCCVPSQTRLCLCEHSTWSLSHPDNLRFIGLSSTTPPTGLTYAEQNEQWMLLSKKCYFKLWLLIRVISPVLKGDDCWHMCNDCTGMSNDRWHMCNNCTDMSNDSWHMCNDSTDMSDDHGHLCKDFT